jgi:hypothetical protein
MRARHLLILLALAVPIPAAAQALPGGGSWAPGPDASGDNTFAGVIDQPANGSIIAAGAAFHISGWVVDTTAQGWAGVDDLNVFLGSTRLVRGVVAGSRPDVATATGNGFWAASGFDAVMPGGALPPGTATLTVVAHTPGKGSWSRQVSVTVSGAAGAVQTVSGAPASGALQVTVLAPTPNQEVPGTNNGTIRGTAGDTRTRAELGSGVDRIQVYLDARRGVAGSQFVGTATITGNTWALDWQPTKYNSTKHHIMYIYARSAVTGEEVLLSQDVNISS